MLVERYLTQCYVESLEAFVKQEKNSLQKGARLIIYSYSSPLGDNDKLAIAAEM